MASLSLKLPPPPNDQQQQQQRVNIDGRKCCLFPQNKRLPNGRTRGRRENYSNFLIDRKPYVRSDRLKQQHQQQKKIVMELPPFLIQKSEKNLIWFWCQEGSQRISRVTNVRNATRSPSYSSQKHVVSTEITQDVQHTFICILQELLPPHTLL